ncbi:uncharacterized protein LOC105663317 isoform X2 [Megachile rotundata]|uniref:uncharacterized protein LOC105663317 isoform X2 n=1 Tax=Megachile rotundata TaxID=143995 RepID=UPI003FD4E2E4
MDFTHNTCHEEANRKNRSRKSKDCNEFQKSCRQGANYAMCEHEKVGNKDCDSRYDNCGNENDVAFDVNGSNEPCERCKSGINVNVVLHQDTPTNCTPEPKYNVSFKHCCDENNPKCEKRRKRSNPITLTGSFFNLSKTKKHKKPETNRSGALSLVQQKAEGCDENGSNFRCTFENCCGNCESYIMEIPQNDMSTYQNWQNMEFEAGNTCFDECCCPREMKMYSSNLSLATPRHEQCCVTYTENEKCCSHPIETKCTFLPNDRKESSKHCLQRVHFAKAENCTRPNHSSCSFCSRKCTPSKASLFVEISESIADICNLRSAQVFQICHDSKESLKSDHEQKEHLVKRKKSDLLRGRFKPKKHVDAKCNLNCKGLPAAVTRSYSDRVACMEKYDDCEREDEKGCIYGKTRNAKSSVSFQESRDCRAQTESNMYINKKTASCNQQCQAINRSLWEDIRKAKIWSQMQDTCKSLVKLATASISQVMKQSAKLKKKYAKGRSKEKCPYANQCDQSVNECCDETMIESKTCDASYCGNMCCSLNQISEIAGLQECQIPMCQTCGLCHNEQEATSSDRSSCFSSDDIQGNSYPFNEGPLQDQLLPTCDTVRERGGSDGRRITNQKKRIMNPNRYPVQTEREQPGTSNNRRNTNPRNQANRRRPGNPDESQDYDYQSDHATICIDMNLDSSTIRAVIEPVECPYVMESMSYQKRVRAVRRMDRYPDSEPPRERYLQPIKKEAPMIEETPYVAPPVRSFKEEMKKPKKTSLSATRKSDVKSPAGRIPTKTTGTGRVTKSEINNKKAPPPKRDAYKSVAKAPVKGAAKSPRFSKEIQCEIIQAHAMICGDREMASQVQQLCFCSPQTAAAPLSPEVAEEDAADVAEDAVEETVQEVEIADVKQEIASVETVTTVMDETASVQTESIHEETEEFAETEEDTPEEVETISLEETEVTEDKEATPVIEEETLEEEVTPIDEEEVTPIDEEEVTPIDEEEITPIEEEEEETTSLKEEEEEETGDQEETAKSTQVEETEKQAVEVDRTSAEESAAETSVTPMAGGAVVPRAMQPGEKTMEFYREFRTRRNYVSVEMQTSSTILTKILSEFQVGNKKRQILMNIKLQTSLNGSTEEEQEQHQQLETTDTSIADSKDQSSTNDDMLHYYREHKPVHVDKAMQLGPRNLTGPLNGLEGNDGSNANLCSGPCGRKKYP